jgi:hypothetical protein
MAALVVATTHVDFEPLRQNVDVLLGCDRLENEKTTDAAVTAPLAGALADDRAC